MDSSTPTFKIKRAVLEERYEPLFERWAGLREPVVGLQAL